MLSNFEEGYKQLRAGQYKEAEENFTLIINAYEHKDASVPRNVNYAKALLNRCLARSKLPDPNFLELDKDLVKAQPFVGDDEKLKQKVMTSIREVRAKIKESQPAAKAVAKSVTSVWGNGANPKVMNAAKAPSKNGASRGLKKS